LIAPDGQSGSGARRAAERAHIDSGPAQALDDKAIVHDLVAYIDGSAEFL
jgi:hypothetical protein